MATVRSLDMQIDVTEAAGLGEPAHIALTVTAPDTVPEKPIVCFAKPGAGYSRGYYTEDLPGPGLGAQATWHAERGWIVVSVDHLGVGESSLHAPERLTYAPVIAASEAAESVVREKLAGGTLMDGLGPVAEFVTIGIGQSMGGAFTIVQQGRHHGYDGVAVLGYSPLRTQPSSAPGLPPLPLPWVPSDTQLSDAVWTNAPALAGLADLAGMQLQTSEADEGAVPPMAWGFHYDDVDPAVVRRDMDDYPARHGDMPPWGSATIPATAVLWCLAPGSTYAEAAAIRCPVLVALGERDVLLDPRGESRAYESAPSVDLFVCPRMAHMHNFAGTRELFWRRIETWAEWVRAVEAAG